MYQATTQASLAQFEFLNHPDNRSDPSGALIADSNPFGITSAGHNVYVTDAGGHTALEVAPGGQISVIGVIPPQTIDLPAFPRGPTPTEVDAVPTGIIAAPDGDGLLVADYSGFPYFPGTSRIWLVRQGQAPTVFASGLTNAIGLSPARHGGLYALEMTRNGALSGDATGAVIYIAPNKQQAFIACDGLVFPTGIVTGPNGDLYVSNYGTIPGYGEVVRIKTQRRRATDTE